MTYTEKSTQLALDASVAVQVLMGTAPGDCEFIPLKPKAADEAMLADLKARWPGRGLRSVGVIGLCGTAPRCAFKEPLVVQPGTCFTFQTGEMVYTLVRFLGLFVIHLPAVVVPVGRWESRLLGISIFPQASGSLFRSCGQSFSTCMVLVSSRAIGYQAR